MANAALVIPPSPLPARSPLSELKKMVAGGKFVVWPKGADGEAYGYLPVRLLHALVAEECFKFGIRLSMSDVAEEQTLTALFMELLEGQGVEFKKWMIHPVRGLKVNVLVHVRPAGIPESWFLNKQEKLPAAFKGSFISSKETAEIVGKMGVRSPHLNSEAAKRQRVETGGVAEPAAAGAALARSNDGAEARRKPARVASSASSSSAASAASSSGLSLRPQGPRCASAASQLAITMCQERALSCKAADEPPPDGVVPLIFTSKLIGLDFGGPAAQQAFLDEIKADGYSACLDVHIVDLKAGKKNEPSVTVTRHGTVDWMDVFMKCRSVYALVGVLVPRGTGKSHATAIKHSIQGDRVGEALEEMAKTAREMIEGPKVGGGEKTTGPAASRIQPYIQRARDPEERTEWSPLPVAVKTDASGIKKGVVMGPIRILWDDAPQPEEEDDDGPHEDVGKLICGADVAPSAERSFQIAFFRFLARQRALPDIVPPSDTRSLFPDPRLAPYWTLSLKFKDEERIKEGGSMNATVFAALVAEQFNQRVRANTVVIGRLSMAGKLCMVGDVTLKLEAVALEGKRLTEAEPRKPPVRMHVLISPEHMDGGMVIEATGAPVMLPAALWKYLLFYPTPDSKRMLKILFHPPNALGPPPGLNEGDEPYYVPPVPGFAHPENPWKDLLPVRTAFSAEHDGFYTLCNMEPAFITKDTTGLDADQVLPISSVKLLADYEIGADREAALAEAPWSSFLSRKFGIMVTWREDRPEHFKKRAFDAYITFEGRQREKVTMDTNLAVVAAVIGQCIPGCMVPSTHVFIGKCLEDGLLTIAGDRQKSDDPPFNGACLQAFVDAGITTMVAADKLSQSLNAALEEYEHDNLRAIYVKQLPDLMPLVFAPIMDG